MRSVMLLGLVVATALSACELPFGHAPASAFDQICVGDVHTGVCCKDGDGQVLSGDCSTDDNLALN